MNYAQYQNEIALAAVAISFIAVVKGSHYAWRRLLTGLDIPHEAASGSELALSALRTAGVLLTRGPKEARRYAEELRDFLKARQVRVKDEVLAQPVRVFVRDLGNWPKVWKTGTRSYRLRARYASPQGVKKSRMAADAAGLVITAVLLSRATNMPNFQEQWLAFVGISIFLGFAVHKIGRFVLAPLTPWLFTPELDMSFSHGAIQWVGMRRNWFGMRMQEKIFAGENWGFRAEQHRFAAEELRLAQEAVRSGKKEPEMFYQQASEMLIDVGDARAMHIIVAELADDERGDMARRLGIGISNANGAMAGFISDGLPS